MTARPGRRLSDGDRLLLGLSLSLAVHGLAVFAPWPAGGAQGSASGLSVRLSAAALSSAARDAARPAVRPAPAVAEPAAGTPALTAPGASRALPEAETPRTETPPAAASVPAPEASAPAAAGGEPALADDEGLPQRLGLDVYYPAGQLERLAEPLAPIVPPILADMPGDPPAFELRVYINEQGGVDAAQWVGAAPADGDAQLEPFRRARFLPARKDGIAVKSYKRILLETTPLDATATPASP
ncbi:protein TonB [Chromobacterium alkanivorans]|uniref:hypothetical protein n=1 Tax=Chromobacterium alkanivorans TaxID=1071719 RepID=UPI0021690D19|nr:hypothetical protein [Chromobacterium alkanivorans]MCS3804756.1 protein TonB [Chromobacterium alkanivorans]MCS3819095.1 protein TonB [Chromobacterium alkanivorans]MCS3873047.1 protein TonB [Chromobacterium alkanivorans]